MTDVQNIQDWMDSTFFEKGTFAVLKNQTLIMGKGGYFSEEKNPERVVFFYIKEFYSTKYNYYYPESILEISTEDVAPFLNPLLKLNIKFEGTTNFDAIFEQDFSKLKKELNDDFQKAVLISSENTLVDNTIHLKKKIMAKAILSKVGTPYGLWFDHYAIIGVTPEILFDKESNKLESVALAGTAKLGEENKLFSSLKDRKEHNLVIANILEELKPFCSEILKSETVIAPYAKMIHLKTDITGYLKSQTQIVDLINTLSPTAALGGHPKKKAKEFLESTQYYKKFPNRFFGSVFGINYHEKHRALVMIRNIQIQGKEMVIESGAGIVQESDIDNELNEINLKRNTVKEMLL